MGDEMWLTSVRHRGVSASGAGERGGAPVAPRLFVAVPGGDSWHLRLGTTEDSRRRTELAVVDQSTSFDFRTREPGTIVALHLPQSWLILPTETVRLGIRNLDDSNPLTMFVRNHLVHLGRIAEHHPGVLPELASASTDIVRSLLLTSAQTEARDPVDDLIVRVKAYIDEHLTDADLSAETIAAAQRGHGSNGAKNNEVRVVPGQRVDGRSCWWPLSVAAVGADEAGDAAHGCR